MTETHDTQGADEHGTATDPGPRLNRDQFRDVDRLRRSSTDRYVAGVAGGLGRHFGVDPTIVRVALVVLTFFGGAGLLLYAACWLFVPEEGREDAPIQTSPDTRRIVLGAVAVIAAIGLLGNVGGGYGWDDGWPWLVVPVVLVVVLLSRRRERRPGTPTAPPPAEPPTVEMSQTTPPWQPPVPPAYTPPPRPRRTGMVLFWPTLALIAVALGALGIYDIDNPVATGAWVALPLAIVGLMLVLGAFAGRGGGLIALGVLLVPTLAITTAVDEVSWNDERVVYTPSSAAQVLGRYDEDNGRVLLDLSEVRDPQNLDGRTVRVELDAGEIDVILPRQVTTEVDARIEFAGDLSVLGHHSNGFQPDWTTTVPAAGKSRATLRLDVDAGVGSIEIERH